MGLLHPHCLPSILTAHATQQPWVGVCAQLFVLAQREAGFPASRVPGCSLIYCLSYKMAEYNKDLLVY